LKNKIDKKKKQKTIQLKEKKIGWNKKKRKLFVIAIKLNLAGQL
jgi:hypothetical protein